MKKLASLAGLLFCLLSFTQSQAQCDYNDTAPVTIGQVLIDSANCPYSGSITINNVNGGGGQYIYEIIKGPVIRIIQSQNSFYALTGGTYVVRVSGCGGQFRDTTITVPSNYTGTMNAWLFQVAKVSGYYCGVNNDGRYVIYSTIFDLFGSIAYPGGSKPYRYQISTGTDFTSVPFEPGVDSIVFNNLLASTTYNVRITDACNNFITKTFSTGAIQSPGGISVPELAITRRAIAGSCSGKESINIQIRDSVTNTPYNPALATFNKEFWGHSASYAYLRIKVENTSTGEVYSDRHASFTSPLLFGFMGVTIGSTNLINGETGLTDLGTGQFYNSDFMFVPSVIYPFYLTGDYPAGTNLKITVYFPGGDHCGTIVPAYSKSYTITTGSNAPAPVKIAALSPACGSFSNKYFRADFTATYIVNNMKLIDITGGAYNVVYQWSTSYAFSYNTFNIDYNGLIIGNNYRLIVTDTCGNVDSLSNTYSPGTGSAPPPIVTEAIKPYFGCPADPNGSSYKIRINPFPTNYYISNVAVAGYGSVRFSSIPNWNNTGLVAYMIDTLLPPGTYNYSLVWVSGCSGGIINRTVTITPQPIAPQYTYNFNLTQTNTAVNCGVDGKTTLSLTGDLENINTNYYIKAIRLTAVPGNYVFPMVATSTYSLTAVNQEVPIYFTTITRDKYVFSTQSPFVIDAGNGGTYQFAMDLACPDGTVATTITRSVNITAPITATPSMPDLKYSMASLCDGNDFKVIMSSLGGKRPLRYEYKLSTNTAYTTTGTGGTDSVVNIVPTPAPGTIYDLRVTDACGNAVTSKVSAGSLTGSFYIYQLPLDCTLNPFDVRVGTSAILGAYYTWRRNGVIFDQGYNLNQTTVTGVSVDVITVEINAFGCYNRTANRTITFTNPCTIIILPVNSIKLSGNRLSAANVQLSWKYNTAAIPNYFVIERSSNGSDFSVAGQVAPISSEKEINYTLEDAAQTGATFYRIKMMGKDGKVIFSNVISLTHKEITKAMLQAIPNPAHDDVRLYSGVAQPKAFMANIFNDKGQLVKQLTISAEESVAGKKVDISTLANGNYFVSLVDNAEVVSSTKFIKQ